MPKLDELKKELHELRENTLSEYKEFEAVEVICKRHVHKSCRAHRITGILEMNGPKQRGPDSPSLH